MKLRAWPAPSKSFKQDTEKTKLETIEYLIHVKVVCTHVPDKRQVLEVCQRKDGDQRQDQPHNYVEGGDMIPRQRQRVGHLGKRHWERLEDYTVEKPSFLSVLAAVH